MEQQDEMIIWHCIAAWISCLKPDRVFHDPFAQDEVKKAKVETKIANVKVYGKAVEITESNKNMRKIITESQLKQIIKETVRRVLNEGKDANQLADAFMRKNPTINKNGLIKLLMADPTASQNDRGSFAGKYGVWIGNMYANGGIKPGDAPELKSALFTYDKNKTQLPQIKDCKSLSELIEWVKDLSDDFKPVRKQSKAKADLEKVYEDDEWIVYVPHSYAAARRGGEGTHWCTASENDYYYGYYSNQGPLYINIRKSDGAKFQFHFETDQFMDANDDPIRLNKIGLSEGIGGFYNKIDPKFIYRVKFDWVSDFKDGFAIVMLNDKYNFINTKGQLLSQQWFDSVWNFKEGFDRVKLNGKYNFINTEGQLLSQQWFDMAWDFNDGFAQVGLNGMWYNLDTEGNLTLIESRRSSSSVITESILKRIKSECIKRLTAMK